LLSRLQVSHDLACSGFARATRGKKAMVEAMLAATVVAP